MPLHPRIHHFRLLLLVTPECRPSSSPLRLVYQLLDRTCILIRVDRPRCPLILLRCLQRVFLSVSYRYLSVRCELRSLFLNQVLLIHHWQMTFNLRFSRCAAHEARGFADREAGVCIFEFVLFGCVQDEWRRIMSQEFPCTFPRIRQFSMCLDGEHGRIP